MGCMRALHEGDYLQRTFHKRDSFSCSWRAVDGEGAASSSVHNEACNSPALLCVQVFATLYLHVLGELAAGRHCGQWAGRSGSGRSFCC